MAYDFYPDFSGFSAGTSDSYTGGGWSPDAFNTAMPTYDFGASTDYGTLFQPYGTSSYFDTSSSLPNQFNVGSVDLGSGTQAGTWFMPESAPNATESGSMLGGIWDKFSALPLDKQLGMGMGLLGGLGSMMNAKNSNKLAKQMSKRNKQLMDAEAAAIARQQKIQKATDPYNYSVDTTTPATVQYNPLSAEQAAHYGETGAPFQQMYVTPGTTTRTMIQGMADGGMAGCGEPTCPHCGGHEGYALGGPTGGQDDKIPAMLSDGEYVVDADTVAALGDGNTKAGAGALDKMRQAVRKHKRSAPVDRIPPKAKPAHKYLPKKGKK